MKRRERVAQALAVGLFLLGRTPISERPRESAEGKDREPPTDSDAAPAVDVPESYLILRWPEADRADAGGRPRGEERT